jgi:hypothetical protein
MPFKILIFLLLACESNTPEPESKIVVIQQTKHSAPEDGDFEKYSFQCCTDPEITELLSSYLTLQEAMAADEESKSKEAGDEFHTQVNALQKKHAPLQSLTQYTSVWGVDSLKEIRMDFEAFNKAFIPFIADFSDDNGKLTVSKAFCPMAPGRWLQKNPQLRNPYYGSEMLTCGVFEE